MGYPPRMLRIVLSVVVIASLATSCVPMRQPPADRIPFPEAEYAALATKGTATVRAQAFLKTRGGDVKTAAGEEALLNPVTTYSQQWYDVSYVGGRDLKEGDPRQQPFIHRKVADAEGRFTFTDVPAGEYFVIARVVWDAPVGYQGALVQQGGWVAKKIAVKDGEQVDVIVTR